MNKDLVYDVEENPKKISEWIIFAIQHILAMLVACITVPLITGLPIGATLIAAGIGTLIYIFCTKKKSPVFLSSSFAYLAPMGSALSVGLINDAAGRNYLGLIIGMLLVGIVYCVIALVIKFAGTKWLSKILPPVVVGPIIMVIGLSLAGSAVSNLTGTNGSGVGYAWPALICGLVAMFATAAAAHYGKGKFISLIPFVIGMGAGYLLALVFTLIGNATGVADLQVISFASFQAIFGKDNFSFASIINYKIFVPNDAESFIFLRFNEIKNFDWLKIGEIILLFVPVAFVTICEHVGDHENLGNIIGRDLLNGEPGMKNTLLGDGIATAVSGALCGAANTTYGENVAVIGTTKIASVNVVLLAALMAIGFGFITPLTALLSTIPKCVTGGVSLLLYGFIASSGVKMLIAEKIDFGIPKNIFIASVILIAGIGGLYFQFFPVKGDVVCYMTAKDALEAGITGVPFVAADGTAMVSYISNQIVGYSLTITSIAVAMILGICLNFALVDKKDGVPALEEKVEESPDSEPKEE